MTNIFMLPDSLADEDRFTAHLHYLIECVPAVGQGMVDALLSAANLPTQRFVRSKDHPAANTENRPDFLLVCEDIDIICEHKLLSPLGPQQLERYLELAWRRPSRVALISNANCQVPAAVLADARYLRPANSTHYLWRDLYELLTKSSDRLVVDFGAYMRARGMNPLTLAGGWSELFENPDIAEAFGEQFRRVRSHFSQLGARCTIDATRRGFQIGKPTPWLHLLYLYVAPSSELLSSAIEDAVLGARLYVQNDALEVDAFRHGETGLTLGGHDVDAFARDRVAPWNPALRCVYEYNAPLAPALSDDANAIQQRLLEFATGVLAHSEALVARQERPLVS